MNGRKWNKIALVLEYMIRIYTWNSYSHSFIGHENSYSKAISLYLLQFSIKTIHFPNGVVISRTPNITLVMQDEKKIFCL
jgi:hypothetical protein